MSFSVVTSHQPPLAPRKRSKSGLGIGDRSLIADWRLMDDINADFDSSRASTLKKSKKSVLRDDAVQYTEVLSKRGVIYVSRIPPFMKPNKMRGIFEEYGEVTRLYLAEEDAEQRRKRKELGGNASKQFREGWVEYSDKKVAKRVAESLNNTIIGGKKGSFYHDDIWNLKYLKGFKYTTASILKLYWET